MAHLSHPLIRQPQTRASVVNRDHCLVRRSFAGGRWLHVISPGQYKKSDLSVPSDLTRPSPSFARLLICFPADLPSCPFSYRPYSSQPSLPPPTTLTSPSDPMLQLAFLPYVALLLSPYLAQHSFAAPVAASFSPAGSSLERRVTSATTPATTLSASGKNDIKKWAQFTEAAYCSTASINAWKCGGPFKPLSPFRLSIFLRHTSARGLILFRSLPCHCLLQSIAARTPLRPSSLVAGATLAPSHPSTLPTLPSRRPSSSLTKGRPSPTFSPFSAISLLGRPIFSVFSSLVNFHHAFLSSPMKIATDLLLTAVMLQVLRRKASRFMPASLPFKLLRLLSSSPKSRRP
jgi:hypothetical protein